MLHLVLRICLLAVVVWLTFDSLLLIWLAVQYNHASFREAARRTLIQRPTANEG